MSTPKIRVLCVEDHVDTCTMYRVLLELDGYQADCADSVSAAMALIEAQRYDVFILDHGLGGDENGVDLCEWIRQRQVEVPIILASGKAYPTEQREALAAGANAYLVKPIDPQHLLGTVAQLLVAG